MELTLSRTLSEINLTDFQRSKCLGLRDHLLVRETEIAGRVLVSTLIATKTVKATQIDEPCRQRWQMEVDLHSRHSTA